MNQAITSYAIFSEKATMEEPSYDLKTKLYLMKQAGKSRQKERVKEKNSRQVSDLISMIPTTIAAAITSTVGSVNQASLGTSISILAGISFIPVSLLLEIPSYLNPTQEAISIKIWNKPINMLEVYKLSIISTPSKKFSANT